MIWDTAGQERFREIVKAYLKAAAGFMVVYDITDMQSFIDVQEFISMIQNHGTSKAIVLVGNKTDLD